MKETGEVLVDVPRQSYSEPRAQVTETVFLPTGALVVWTIEDQFGDGLCCNSPGNFLVAVGQSPDGEVLLSGGGNFGYKEEHEIRVPLSYNSGPQNEEPTTAVGEGQIALTVVIRLDAQPEGIGWKVDRLDIEVDPVISVPAGVYNQPKTTITRTLILDEGELYLSLIHI